MRRTSSYLDNFGRLIHPEVERPNFVNQVIRPLLNGAILIALYIGLALSAIAWALLFGQWAGVGVAVGVFVYAVRSVSFAPPRIEWKKRATTHKRTLLGLLAFAFVLGVLAVTHTWPALIVWDWYEGGQWVGIGKRALEPCPALLTWLRLALLVVIPLAIPRVWRLLDYRFRVETVYPTLTDSVNMQGRQFNDRMDLIDFIHAGDSGEAFSPSSRPNPATDRGL